MKRLLVALTLAVFAIGATASAYADAAVTFKKKCAGCHGKDGKAK